MAILWGKDAQSLTRPGETPIIASPHPSLLFGASRFFLGRGCFRVRTQFDEQGRAASTRSLG